MASMIDPARARLARGWAAARLRLGQPWDIAGLAALRVLFGAMMATSLVRFAGLGWIEKVLVEPSYFFKFPGFEWTVVGDPPVLYAHFALTAAAAACVALGLFYRVAIVGFWVGFTYLQLLDVTLYLNHYYLVVLVGGILAFTPAHRAWSLDAWRRSRRDPGWSSSVAPAWCYLLLRFQVAVVYFFAALAKAQPDWLLHAQPIAVWMRARTETPVIGALLDEPEMAFALAWFGFLYDLSIWVFLLFRPTRRWAYLAVLGFHFFTWVFFEIGMFPIIMVVLTTAFFDPSWPRSLLARLQAAMPGSSQKPGSSRAPRARAPIDRHRPLSHLGFAVLVAYASVQVALPLRHYALPGDVLWGERGMRFSWKVMVREKNGAITYRVRQVRTGRIWQVSPFDYLTWRQFSDMSGQPDLIFALGRHIAEDFAGRGLGPVEVRVDALVSLNGRPPAPLVDPDVDIVRLLPSDLDGWIRPAPAGPPAPADPTRAAVLTQRPHPR